MLTHALRVWYHFSRFAWFRRSAAASPLGFGDPSLGPIGHPYPSSLPFASRRIARVAPFVCIVQFVVVRSIVFAPLRGSGSLGTWALTIPFMDSSPTYPHSPYHPGLISPSRTLLSITLLPQSPLVRLLFGCVYLTKRFLLVSLGHTYTVLLLWLCLCTVCTLFTVHAVASSAQQNTTSASISKSLFSRVCLTSEILLSCSPRPLGLWVS